ncbi:hypothetical protein ACHQM5_008997 [Ranunculus cassubicifolius]
MRVCKSLFRSSLISFEHQLQSLIPNNSRQNFHLLSNSTSNLHFAPPKSANQGLRFGSNRVRSRNYGSVAQAIPSELAEIESVTNDLSLDESVDDSNDLNEDRVEKLLRSKENDVARLMKMERRTEIGLRDEDRRWFPYLDMFKAENSFLTSSEILEVVDTLILDGRKERMRKVIENRTYSVCLVVEGLSDFGNVSAVCRSADALGLQSIHVISCDNSKRYRDNRHVSMGAEKWLDIEVWDSTEECFKALKSRGYRIATTHLGMETVSVYDMDWSCPTAIVVGNESRGISDKALKLSDLHCSIPMNGMVDSFNVSVAAGILMHHAVCDRTSRLGSHGDLTLKERQILTAEFSLRHSRSAISLAHEHAKRKGDRLMPKL